MQACYTSLYNITNEIAEAIFKEQGWNPIKSLKKSVRVFNQVAELVAIYI